ncbi:unnamed protein product [Ambrosiozyma monospora]|uniref:Unnamed protein product n=1 Tax=Ambrosiozyma monospora TaxID=43982 RepID=A0ACB5SY05_AMBMO|nr:unnamed protein product [Ambrosiozyma monospora]
MCSWPTIYTELQSIFQYIYNVLADHHIEEDPSAPSDDNDNLLKRLDNKLVLEACKLLDVILLLKPEEFQLSDWLFISNTTDSVYRETSLPVLGLIEKIGNLRSLRIGSIKSVIRVSATVGTNNNLKKPLLLGVKKIDQVFELKDFFDKLAIFNYENHYSMRDYNEKTIQDDVFNDLFD